MKPVKTLKLKQVNGTAVTPSENLTAKEAPPQRERDQPGVMQALPGVEKPLPPMPPHIGQPVGPPPGPVKAPEGYDELFAMALKLRSNGKPGMMDFWASMAQADALNRIAINLERMNEFFGVFDNDDHPDEDSVRLSDVLTAAISDALTRADAEVDVVGEEKS